MSSLKISAKYQNSKFLLETKNGFTILLAQVKEAFCLTEFVLSYSNNSMKVFIIENKDYLDFLMFLIKTNTNKLQLEVEIINYKI